MNSQEIAMIAAAFAAALLGAGWLLTKRARRAIQDVDSGKANAVQNEILGIVLALVSYLLAAALIIFAGLTWYGQAS